MVATIHLMGFIRSNVVGLVALFIALGGTATAAIVITGADIKDESITGADVKDGTLRLRDIKKSDRAKLQKRGTRGPRGQVGPQGAQGSTGAAGATGAQGVDGPQGATGAQGPMGAQGRTGASGANGVDGQDGWSAYDPPPPGRLFTGGAVLHLQSQNFYGTYIQLPFTLSQGLDDDGAGRNLYAAPDPVWADGEVSADCGGDWSAPDPVAGITCVYVARASNYTPGSAVLTAGVTGQKDQVDGADHNGFSLDLQASSGSETEIRIVWAHKSD